MKNLISIIRKPANLIEIFSACIFFKLKKLIIYYPIVKNKKNYYLGADIKKYIYSFNQEELRFKIIIKKFNPDNLNEIFKLILKNKNNKYVAIQGDNLKHRFILSNYYSKISIGITDGAIDCLSFIDYFLATKSKTIINYLKIPIYLIFNYLFKLKFCFTYFNRNKIFFSKMNKINFEFSLNKKIIKILKKKKKINILIIDDPTKTIKLPEIIKKYNLSNKNYCVISRNGKFKIFEKTYSNYSILPEILLNSGVIKKVYCYPLSSVYLYSIKKNILTNDLPMKKYNFDGLVFFKKYIVGKFFKI